MKRTYWLILSFVTVMLAGFLVGMRLVMPLIAVTGEFSPQTLPPEQVELVLQEAVERSADAKAMDVSAFNLFDPVIDQTFLSEDGQTALLWLAFRDPETGQVLETEPGFAIATLNGEAKLAEGWQITLQADAAWDERLAALPEGLVNESAAEFLTFSAPLEEPKDIVYYTGYKLPWAAGLSKRLTQSISHISTSCTNLPTCVNAFDFADGTMFPLLAAKGGTVHALRITCANGSESCTNYLVLQDRSTTPTTYQVYYHLAFNSIPTPLRTIGAPVAQGQFIGNVDDTGYSTGHHLHFHVTKDSGPAWYQNIVPIRFADVDINNGQPRLCYEVPSGTPCRTYYVSGNAGAFPPNGNITSPAPGASITASRMNISGSVSDDQGVTKVVALVNTGDGWVETSDVLTLTGSTYTNKTFSGTVDLCKAGVSRGSFQLALRIWDHEGNQTTNFPGQRTLTSTVSCTFTAEITSPTTGATANGSSLTVSGSVKADAGLSQVTLWVGQDGHAWVDYPVTMGSNDLFSKSINLCADGFKAGPVTLMLEVIDSQGNVLPGEPGLREIVNTQNCAPVDTCFPGDDQAAVYSDPNYGGTCKLLNPGAYTNLSPLGPDDIESVRVGSTAHLILFDGPNYDGRSEAITYPGDANLSDNIIGLNRAASVQLQKIFSGPPYLPDPADPVQAQPSAALGRSPTTADSLVLTWSGSAGSTHFQSRLTYPDGTFKVMTWRPGYAWSVGNLPAGTYTWWVGGGAYLGTAQEKRSPAMDSTPITFTVENATLSTPAAVNAPMTLELDSASGWTATGGWQHATDIDGRTGFRYGSGGYGSPQSGDLTSPPIRLPSGDSYLQFTYWNSTESNQPWWDQRRVQVSANGGAFEDLALISGDAAGAWLDSYGVDLTPYAGQTVRLRFNFSTLDASSNNHDGWWIDAVRVISGAVPEPCLESVPNNTLAGASPISLGYSYNRLICPGSDLDHFKFSAAAGDRLSLDVLAMSQGSPLDPYLSLLDANGSLILENDDIDTGVERDSHISFYVPQSGSYYLQVRAWDYPSAGSSEHSFTVKTAKDSVAPNLSLVGLVDGSPLTLPMTINASASDTGSALRVNFYWHAGDWLNGEWQYLGTDFSADGGWNWEMTAEQVGGAYVAGLYVEAVDGAGNSAGRIVFMGPMLLEPALFLPSIGR